MRPHYAWNRQRMRLYFWKQSSALSGTFPAPHTVAQGSKDPVFAAKTMELPLVIGLSPPPVPAARYHSDDSFR